MLTSIAYLLRFSIDISTTLAIYVVIRYVMLPITSYTTVMVFMYVLLYQSHETYQHVLGNSCGRYEQQEGKSPTRTMRTTILERMRMTLNSLSVEIC